MTRTRIIIGAEALAFVVLIFLAKHAQAADTLGPAKCERVSSIQGEPR